jgi:hypothetical protein
MEFLNTEHVAVIGNGHASHTVTDGFVYEPFDTRLTI